MSPLIIRLRSLAETLRQLAAEPHNAVRNRKMLEDARWYQDWADRMTAKEEDEAHE